MKKKVQLCCPICKQPVKSANEDFPFCSERCRTIDLGRWASGAYVIPSPVNDTEDEAAELPPRKDTDPENE